MVLLAGMFRPGTLDEDLVRASTVDFGGVTRWEAGDTIRYWIDGEHSSGLLSERYETAVLESIQAWEQVGVPLVFEEVADRKRANLVIEWAIQLPLPGEVEAHLKKRSSTPNVDEALRGYVPGHLGRAYPVRTDTGVLQEVGVLLALRYFQGKEVSDFHLQAAASHEIGHALGLPHSEDVTSVMYRDTRLMSALPTNADLTRLEDLYRIPVGSRSRFNPLTRIQP